MTHHDYTITDPQLRYYRDHPTKYAETAAKIDLYMRVGDRPCRGGECDMDDPCPRHAKTLQIADRWWRRFRKETK